MTHYYISVDMEGIAGVSSPRQLTPQADAQAYALALEQLHRELGYLVQGILKHDAEAKITINDAHTLMTNLRPDHPWAQNNKTINWITGKPKPKAMMFGLQDDVDIICLLGYHAKAGTLNGTLAHSFHFEIADITLNGVSYGEAGINGLYAQLQHNAVIGFTSGDDIYQAEMNALNKNIPFAQTKIGKGWATAEHLPTPVVEENYHQALEQLFKLGPLNTLAKQQLMLTLPKAPYQLVIQFIDPLAADVAALNPSLKRIDGTSVAFEHNDFDVIYRTLQTAYTSLSALASVR